MNQKKLLLLSLAILGSVEQLKGMQNTKSQFIIMCIPGKTGIRGYGEQYTSPTQFSVHGIQEKNALIDTKTLFDSPAFTEKFESSMETNMSSTFLAQDANKQYVTKIVPFMAQDNKTLLLVKIKEFN